MLLEKMNEKGKETKIETKEEKEEEEKNIDLQAKATINKNNQENENTPRSSKIPLENLPDVTETTKKKRQDRPKVINTINLSKKDRNNNRRHRSKAHRIQERERARTTTREARRYKEDKQPLPPKSNNNDNNTNRFEHSTYNVCKKRFGIITDPRFSITKNADHMIINTNPNDLPRKPSNLECHNLCRNPEAVIE